MSGAYWGLCALEILNAGEEMNKEELVSWVLKCQNEDGGFGGNVNHDSNLVYALFLVLSRRYTLSALQILAICDKLELIDAEETPKNVMLRAHRLRRADPVRCRLARTRYREAAAFLGVSPYRGLGGEEAEPRSGEESPSPVERLREVDFRPADEKRE